MFRLQPRQEQPVTSTTDRALRADAQTNHDRLLEVAAAVFTRDGDEASMRSIAKEAGVGVGTLYRRFPTREHLVEATYRSETARLGSAAAGLLEQRPPVEALRTWMDGFVEYMTAKHAMGEALKGILVDDGVRMQSRRLLTDAIRLLLDAGAAAGTLRSDVDAYDVLLGLGGITFIAGDDDRADITARLLDLLVDGLRFGTDSRDGPSRS
jgi:AcrR family transcriptional regulator